MRTVLCVVLLSGCEALLPPQTPAEVPTEPLDTALEQPGEPDTEPDTEAQVNPPPDPPPAPVECVCETVVDGVCVDPRIHRFVDAAAPANGDGLSWETAYDNILDAQRDGVDDVYVRSGVYSFSFDQAMVQMCPDVQVLGGFSHAHTGSERPDPTNRSYSDRSRLRTRVASPVLVDMAPGSVFDGFVIEDIRRLISGRVSTPYAPILIDDADGASVQDVTLRNNLVTCQGPCERGSEPPPATAGIACLDSDDVVLRSIDVSSNNTAGDADSPIHLEGCGVDIVDSRFEDNWSDSEIRHAAPAVLYAIDSRVDVRNSDFRDNGTRARFIADFENEQSAVEGGAVALERLRPSLWQDVRMRRNSATGAWTTPQAGDITVRPGFARGGALAVDSPEQPLVIRGATFTNNSAIAQVDDPLLALLLEAGGAVWGDIVVEDADDWDVFGNTPSAFSPCPLGWPEDDCADGPL